MRTWEPRVRVVDVGKEQCWGMSVWTNIRDMDGENIFLDRTKRFFATTALFLEELCKGHVAALFFDLKSRFFLSMIVGTPLYETKPLLLY